MAADVCFSDARGGDIAGSRQLLMRQEPQSRTVEECDYDESGAMRAANGMQSVERRGEGCTDPAEPNWRSPLSYWERSRNEARPSGETRASTPDCGATETTPIGSTAHWHNCCKQNVAVDAGTKADRGAACLVTIS